MAASDGLKAAEGFRGQEASLPWGVEADGSPKFGLRPHVLKLFMVRGKPCQKTLR